MLKQPPKNIAPRSKYGKKSARRDSVRNAYSIAKANLMSWKLLSVQKKLASLDGS
jgi:hypothetical protein